MTTKQAEWTIRDSEFTEVTWRRLRNKRWVLVTDTMQSTGKWDKTAQYISEAEAARLLIEVGERLDGTHLHDYATDNV